MAKQDGKAMWAIDNDQDETDSDEAKEVEKQARQFLEDNDDIVQMLRTRFDELKASKDGNSLLMLAQLLYNMGVELSQWVEVYGVVKPDSSELN